MISTRLVELVIDTVVRLTLAKWETVSGQFGGYLRLCGTVVSTGASSLGLGRKHQPHDTSGHFISGSSVSVIPPGERREKTEWHRVVIFNEGL